jgi:hypothetical protein
MHQAAFPSRRDNASGQRTDETHSDPYSTDAAVIRTASAINKPGPSNGRSAPGGWVDELRVSFFVVIPAKAGIQRFKTRHLPWIPAFAGMTVENKAIARIKCDRPAQWLWFLAASPLFVVNIPTA